METHGRRQRPARRDWKRVLQGILDAHNNYHASRSKLVGFGTSDQRAKGLFRAFTTLRRLGYTTLDPVDLGGRHVAVLVRYWTADPGLPAELLARAAKLAPRATPYSAAYIQQQLSFLRVFAGWIGKPGMVLPARSYVADAALVTRRIAVARDRSWNGADLDVDAVLADVARRDQLVALQLELMLAFGLRRKEAVMFSPALAEVPAEALPASIAPGRYLWFLRIKRGTKGGRLRFTAIRNPAQERALERARALASRPGQHIGRPDATLKQSLDRFSRVLQAAGITRRALGVTGHGLRHQFAADLYFELAEVPAPVRGGARLDPDAMRAAYLEVARQLGHGRPQISSAYLGSRAATGVRSSECDNA